MPEARDSGALATLLRGFVHRTFAGDQGPAIDHDAPLGDPGWFGPDSVTWRVHADFAGMLAGGLCALHLQVLHPRALAGVWDHSDFRRDLLGRLRRTTAFVAGTSYAPTDAAARLAARVRAIHARVRGLDEAGRAYAADEPELLAWVHVTETASFLAGYRRYGPLHVPRRVADAYYRETACIADSLGATDVPRSEAEVEAFLGEVRPRLRFTARSAEVLAVLGAMPLPVPAPALGRGLFLHAGAALLPDWASALLGRGLAERRLADAASLALEGLAPAFRDALDDNLAIRAMRRCGRDPAALTRWPQAPA